MMFTVRAIFRCRGRVFYFTLCGFVLAIIMNPLNAFSDDKNESAKMRELFAGAPDLRSNDQKIKTLYATGRFLEGPVRFSFELSYSQPDHGLVAILDQSDGTPVFLWHNGKWLEYFPFERKVRYMDQGFSSFSFRADPQKHTLDVNYRVKSDANRTTGIIFDIDLKSLIDPNAATWSTATLGGGIVELRGVSPRGSLVTARINPSQQWPYEGVSIFGPGSKEADLAISTLVNQKLPPDSFRFPSRAAVAAAVPILDGSRDAETEKSISSHVTLEWGYRAALKHPELRSFVGEKMGRPIDWDAEQKLEEQTSTALTQLIKQAGLGNVDLMTPHRKPSR